MQNLATFHQFVQKLLSANEILTKTKGHNYLVNLRKLMHNNPNVAPDKIIAYVKICLFTPIRSQDIVRERNSGIYQGSLVCLKLANIDT